MKYFFTGGTKDFVIRNKVCPSKGSPEALLVVKLAAMNCRGEPNGQDGFVETDLVVAVRRDQRRQALVR